MNRPLLILTRPPWLQFSLLVDDWVPLLSVLLPNSAAEMGPICNFLDEVHACHAVERQSYAARNVVFLTGAVASSLTAFLPLAQDLECDSAMLVPKSLLSSHLAVFLTQIKAVYDFPIPGVLFIVRVGSGEALYYLEGSIPAIQGDVGPCVFDLLMAPQRPTLQYVGCCN